MNIDKLLKELKDKANIFPAETRTLADGTKVIMLGGTLPAFPHGSKPVWYPLIMKPNQIEVPRYTIEAILRHFWQFQLDILPDDSGDL